MKFPLHTLSLVVALVCSISVDAQRRRSQAPTKIRGAGNAAIVIDESLSVLRSKPSLFAQPVQRMRRGRRVQILGASEADGVRFYKVAAPPVRSGWIQSDAIFGKFRPADEERLARLVQASDGFDQIELARLFLDLYPRSAFRPPILLLVGDLLEEAAVKLSRDASSRLNRREMAASGAPLHSFYLNFTMLDRYRRLGVTFLFNESTRKFHYDGGSWREIVRRFPEAAEAAEASKRLDSLQTKMDTVASN